MQMTMHEPYKWILTENGWVWSAIRLIKQNRKSENAEHCQLRIDDGSTYVLNTIVTSLPQVFNVHLVLMLEFRLELLIRVFFNVMLPTGFYYRFIPDILKVKILLSRMSMPKEKYQWQRNLFILIFCLNLEIRNVWFWK